jgi:hypothetical protein
MENMEKHAKTIQIYGKSVVKILLFPYSQLNGKIIQMFQSAPTR